MQLEFEINNNKNIRLMAFEIVRSMLENQKGNYQGSTIWSCEKAILKNKILKSLH